MARIKCHYVDCVFLDEGYCSAAQIELDPDTGCATYSPAEGIGADGSWEEETDEWEDDELDEEDEEWLDEDEDEI